MSFVTHSIGKAHILIASVRALSNEVCKNLALAGVASITLLDHEIVKEYDLGSQFLLHEDDIGKNVISIFQFHIEIIT
jgi:ubiquitin-like 1-activating enzyme E1 A